MVILIDAKRSFDKIQHTFRIRILETAGLEGTNLRIIKAKYEKLSATLEQNEKKHEVFPLKLKSYRAIHSAKLSSY